MTPVRFRGERVTMARFLDRLDEGPLGRFSRWLEKLTPEAFVGLAYLLALAIVGVLFLVGALPE